MKVERLYEIVQIFQEGCVFDRIATASKPARETVYKIMQKDLLEKSSPLKKFKDDAWWEIIIEREEEEGIIDNGEISANQALPICLICIMTEIDHWDLLQDRKKLISALQQVKGRWEETAKKFSNYLMKGKAFSLVKPEQINQFFS